tara:strand:- start:659 stop:859 length:201 start_codon:yes stop_codon:yes gene_type:complete
MKNYTNEEVHEMYLDWFNNFLSTGRFAERYDLSMTEVENVLDRGRKIQELINKQIENGKKTQNKES